MDFGGELTNPNIVMRKIMLLLMTVVICTTVVAQNEGDYPANYEAKIGRASCRERV